MFVLFFPPGAESLSDPPLPRGVHVSHTTTPQHSLTFVWFTDGPTDPGTFVQYGTTTMLDRIAAGTSLATPGVEALAHEVTVKGLTSDTEIHYRVGAPGAWSDVFTTRTAPPAGAPLRIILMADHGTSDAALRTNERLVLEDADLLIIAGDLSYANGEQPVWDLWFDQIQPWASRIPTLASIGNHEYETGYGSAAFETRMALPGAELYYGIDYGRLHFLFLDSYTSSSVPAGHFDEMVAYAEADLAAAAARRDAGLLDHLFIVQHHPMYSNHEDAQRKVQPDMAALVEQWIHRYDVGVLVAGHNHHYERSYPMAYGLPTDHDRAAYEEPTGFIQLTTGGAGRSLYGFDHPEDFLPWSAAHARRHHYTIMEVAGPTLTFTAVSSDHVPGEVLDRFTLTNA